MGYRKEVSRTETVQRGLGVSVWIDGVRTTKGNINEYTNDRKIEDVRIREGESIEQHIITDPTSFVGSVTNNFLSNVLNYIWCICVNHHRLKLKTTNSLNRNASLRLIVDNLLSDRLPCANTNTKLPVYSTIRKTKDRLSI